ncbi:dihydrolipoyllysine-residue acetyltransferase [Acinetobacter baumannii]|nr:dihydrolipoyllysine-residue acetyltransferase [Acinetobacter baumannii]MDC5031065.1 dihydrolipoyllysine-residue acetyltransferase [Acinetobacter baumannii]MDC5376532.1 dihydrolipoyllysine-residue acetyltransferase [Acinetobacter baumannii]
MQIKTPDIGVDKANVAEILVKVGDRVEVDDSIVVLESDKATVEVPSTSAGVVKSILINQGDDVTEGVALIEIEAEGAAQPAPEPTPAPVAEKPAAPAPAQQTQASAQPAAATSTATVEVTVPDIGVEKALVGEILVKVGDQIDVEQSIVVVESDKATVEVPSSVAGTVESIQVKEGDTVKEGVVLIQVKTAAASNAQAEAPAAAPAAKAEAAPAPQAAAPKAAAPVATQSAPVAPTSGTDKLTKEQEAENAKVYAGPAVRKLARELGVILSQVKTSGEHGRVVKEDIFAYVKSRLTAPQAAPVAQATAAPAGLPSLPDFTAFGGGEVKPMTRLQQVSVPQLSLNNYIPQVTQFDLADITELEAWRGELKDGFKKQGVSLTILAFIAKAVAHLLKEEPYFAGHLADDQKSVLLRNEIHMGIAVATPDGLTVPVLRNPDQKSIKQIAVELGELSKKARDKKLTPKDLQGANFTITSLGSIGGTAFTPLVNWPQVAILGISPATMQPVWNGKDFDPRLMLPLSLSYDHRVINGADAARFTNKLTKLLKDIRTLLI